MAEEMKLDLDNALHQMIFSWKCFLSFEDLNDPHTQKFI